MTKKGNITRRKFTSLILAVSATVTSLCAMHPGTASASPYNADTLLNQGTTVFGGSAQSDNPASYDYVPKTSTATSAVRSASGYAWIPAFHYQFGGVNIPVPGGQIFHRIDGQRTHINEEAATYSAPANICNYRFDFQNRDNFGRIVSTRSTGIHNGCQFGMVGHAPLKNFDIQPGMMCARLFVSGSFRGEQCHHIYR